MKRRIMMLSLVAALCGTAFVGCQKDNLLDKDYNTIITIRSNNNGAKTHYNPADYSVNWDEGDQISVSRGNTTNENPFSTFDLLWPLEQDGAARFAGNISATEGIYYAIYPAQDNLSVNGDKLTCEAVRTNQVLTPSTFGRGCNTAVGYNDNTTMRFRNVGGLAKIALTGNAMVKSVKITNNATTDNILSGRGTIDLIESDGSLPIEWANNGIANYVEATAADDDGIDVSDPKIFYIVLPPCTLDNYTVTIKDVNDNEVFSQTYTTSVTISRAAVTELGQYDVNAVAAGPASNEICYTTTDNRPISAFETASNFGAGSFVSNSWDASRGCFVATYSGNVTTIGIMCLKDQSTLQSIAFPEGPTEIGHFAFARDSSLRKITIPEFVISVRRGSFGSCTSLDTVVIPNQNVKIDDDAFFGSGLCVLILNGNNAVGLDGPEIADIEDDIISQMGDRRSPEEVLRTAGWNPFRGCRNDITVYVPDVNACRNIMYPLDLGTYGSYDYYPWRNLVDNDPFGLQLQLLPLSNLR